MAKSKTVKIRAYGVKAHTRKRAKAAARNARGQFRKAKAKPRAPRTRTRKPTQGGLF